MIRFVVRILASMKNISFTTDFPFFYWRKEWYPELFVDKKRKSLVCMWPEAYMKPGDIIFTRKIGRFLMLFMPSYWHHCSIYIGNNQVLEADTLGVKIITLEECLNCSSAIIGINDIYNNYNGLLNGFSDSLRKIACKAGLPYNFNLCSGNEKIGYCCTGLVNLFLNLKIVPPSKRITPDELAQKMKIRNLF